VAEALAMMSDTEFDEVVASFIATVRIALSDAPTSSYATTVMMVGSRGDLSFELLLAGDATVELDRAKLAFEFGKTLALDQSSVAVVIVGEEMVGEYDVPWIVVTATTNDGRRRTSCMKMSRLPDGSLQHAPSEGVSVVNSNDFKCHLASEVMKGILFRD
jgi:hypothetical protein